jgi:hypothetical protein
MAVFAFWQPSLLATQHHQGRMDVGNGQTSAAFTAGGGTCCTSTLAATTGGIASLTTVLEAVFLATGFLGVTAATSFFFIQAPHYYESLHAMLPKQSHPSSAHPIKIKNAPPLRCAFFKKSVRYDSTFLLNF